MPVNVKAFNSKINKFTKERVPEEVNLIKKKIGMQLLDRIVMMTPVLTGRARGNWQTSIDDPVSSVLDTTSKSGQTSINKGVRVIERVTSGQSIWICNNLPYIMRLEHGWSQQAPAGMLSVALAEVGSQFA